MVSILSQLFHDTLYTHRSCYTNTNILSAGFIFFISFVKTINVGTGTNATVYSAPKYAKDSQESKTPKLDITFQAFSDGSTAPEKLQSWIKEAIKDLESKYIYGTGRPQCAYLVKYMMNNYGKYWHCFNFKSDDYNFSFYEEDPYDDHAAFFTYNNHCWIVFRSKS